MLVLCVVTAGLLAAPAPAAPVASTSITASAGADTLTYGAGTTLSATLWDVDGDVALGGLILKVEQATASETGPWTTLYWLTAPSGPYATGVYTGPVIPAQTTWYRFVFEGTPEYAATTGTALRIAVRPDLGRPYSTLQVKRGKRFLVRGSLKPQFPAGDRTVTLTAYRWVGRTWVKYKSYRATNFDAKANTQYKRTLAIGKKGSYRFKASTKAMPPAWIATTSGFSRTVKVK
jgi:hypothetical protein